jgi:hypothetical protein
MKKYFLVYYPVFVAFVLLVLYSTTLATTVQHIDSGELAAVQWTLGIAHTSGYPLFTLLGFLWSKLPLGIAPITQLNILAMLYVVAAMAVFSVVLRKMIAPFAATPENATMAAVLGTFMTACSMTIWEQSTSTEVYSLHILMLSILLLLLYNVFESNAKKGWITLAIALAFSFSNHLTTILIIPAVAYCFFSRNALKEKTTWWLLAQMVAFFVIILVAFYSYLPLRAAQQPILNWGNPINAENFWRHVTGSQYRIWIFSSSEVASKNLSQFIRNLPQEWNISIFVALIGVVFLGQKQKKLLLFTLITFFATVLYAINYDIKDLGPYFLLAQLSIGIWVAWGVLAIWQWQKNKVIGSFILPMALFYSIKYNYDLVNRRDVTMYADYTQAILSQVPENALIISHQWDYFITPYYYFHLVEKKYPNLVVIDKELLRRSWYYPQLENWYPDVMQPLRPATEQFLQAVRPFEQEEFFVPQDIEKAFRNCITQLIAQNITKRPVYLGLEYLQNELNSGEITLPQGYTVIPAGLLLQVVPKNSGYVAVTVPTHPIYFPKNKEKDKLYVKFMRNMLQQGVGMRMQYEQQFQQKEKIGEWQRFLESKK